MLSEKYHARGLSTKIHNYSNVKFEEWILLKERECQTGYTGLLK
jgi:hypothetical protein